MKFIVISFVSENIVRYSMPQGVMRGDETNLLDTSYDGILDRGYLRDGLGQLVDGLYGEDDYDARVNGENSG